MESCLPRDAINAHGARGGAYYGRLQFDQFPVTKRLTMSLSCGGRMSRVGLGAGEDLRGRRGGAL